MIQGILLKGYSGFYYVFAGGRVWECSLRGRFRLKGQEFLPGDRVQILPGAGNKATIEVVEPRNNSLTRPSIANVDQALLVFAVASPKPDLNLLDRLLVQVEETGIVPVLVFTKTDLWQPGTQGAGLDPQVRAYYASLGYTVLQVSKKLDQGRNELQKNLDGKVSVLAGPSGVGKSSLLNWLTPGMGLKTGEVSEKSRRGRHTTRHVELLVCHDGLVADTPGFSVLYLPKMKREALQEYFVEFARYSHKCRFSTCLHDKEPECAVKDAVQAGEIPGFRYEHYLLFLQEVIANERSY